MQIEVGTPKNQTLGHRKIRLENKLSRRALLDSFINSIVV